MNAGDNAGEGYYYIPVILLSGEDYHENTGG
jgi:hypothetical protein